MFDWERRTQIVVFVLIGALLFGIGYKYAKITAMPDIVVSSGQAGEKEEETSQIIVHVTGAVEKPGIYELESGARVNDAVAMAIPLPEANLGLINLAAVAEDGKRIEVPYKQESIQDGRTSSSSPPSGFKVSEPGRINLNAATVEELDTLPGIGPAYAERIIKYREENGGFSSIEELQDIAGIGPKTYEKLKDMVCVY